MSRAKRKKSEFHTLMPQRDPSRGPWDSLENAFLGISEEGLAGGSPKEDPLVDPLLRSDRGLDGSSAARVMGLVIPPWTRNRTLHYIGGPWPKTRPWTKDRA